MSADPTELETEDSDSERVCAACVGEQFLKAEIVRTGEDATCRYCGCEGKTMSLEELADRIDKAFEQHFERTADQPDGFESAMLSDRESNYEWERCGEQAVYAIASAADIDETIAEDIRVILADRYYNHDDAAMGEENEFAEDAHYAETKTDDHEFQSEWNAFEKDIKTAARFFSNSARATLERVFKDVRTHRTQEGKSVITQAGPQATIKQVFRARVFQSDEKLRQALMRPDREIGPPPADAALPGRMNPAGIAVFYGALDVISALSEVRPPVGSNVVTARFDLLQPVQLLDVDALRDVFVEGSIFDPAYLPRLQHGKFLGHLSATMSRLVLPADERSGYLVTQVIADYLANVEKLDGILYRSVQSNTPAANVVLFHHAAAVEPLPLPEGTEVDASLFWSTEDGDEIDYTVWEKVPDPPIAEPARDGFSHLTPGPFVEEWASLPRVPTLKLDPATVTVHHVAGVTYATHTHPVNRHRTTKPKPGSKPDRADF